jgi:hypothetical protein
MSSIAISLLDLEGDEVTCFEAEDYQTRVGKWCSGCGDFGALGSPQEPQPYCPHGPCPRTDGLRRRQQ